MICGPETRIGRAGSIRLALSIRLLLCEMQGRGEKGNGARRGIAHQRNEQWLPGVEEKPRFERPGGASYEKKPAHAPIVHSRMWRKCGANITKR